MKKLVPVIELTNPVPQRKTFVFLFPMNMIFFFADGMIDSLVLHN